MKRKLVRTLAVAVLAAVAGISGAAQAQAAVAPIWCGTEGLCQIAYANDNYWMAKRNYDGEPWVRLTLVAGWNNANVAPITCENRGACVVVYYDAYQSPGYWMARRWNDTAGAHWVRLTEV